MRFLSTLLMGAVFGATVMFMAYNYQFVRTNDRTLLIPRVAPHLNDIYVDIRSWGYREWQSHPLLTKSLMKSGHGQLIEEAVSGGAIRELLPNNKPFHSSEAPTNTVLQ